jgi:hypothetical protein
MQFYPGWADHGKPRVSEMPNEFFSEKAARLAKARTIPFSNETNHRDDFWF